MITIVWRNKYRKTFPRLLAHSHKYSWLTVCHTVMCVMSYVVDWVSGVTVLDDIMYVVCDESSTILLYNKDTFRPLDVVIKVDGMNWPWDIVVCDRQLYIADYKYCIWRVSVDDHSHVKWLSTESTTHTFHVTALSVTSQRLLVTSSDPPSLRQYNTSDAQLLRVVELPRYVNVLYHSVETTRGTFVICHRDTSQNKEQHAVSELFRFCQFVNRHDLLCIITNVL